MRFRNWLYRFMAGRYGTDDLSKVTLLLAIIISIVSCFFKTKQIIHTVLYLISILLIGITFFRTFSKNISKRYQENCKFVNKKNYLKQRWLDRKTYKYYDCPKCNTHLRVPKGVGIVTITCKKCGTQFDRKA